MKQLIYYSRPFGFDEAMLTGILMQARRNNKRDGITGALICRHDMYLQLIEGPDAAIDALYAKITEDDRHGEVRLALSSEVDQRMFPDWEMLDDTAPTMAFSEEGVENGAIEQATTDALRAVFERIVAKVRR
ncbi:MAG: BLUF domain-containing protein [Erythrobacter sp.]|nr:MAG: BLUF domain-containing protein [Erythrobacter sp.]